MVKINFVVLWVAFLLGSSSGAQNELLSKDISDGLMRRVPVVPDGKLAQEANHDSQKVQKSAGANEVTNHGKRRKGSDKSTVNTPSQPTTSRKQTAPKESNAKPSIHQDNQSSAKAGNRHVKVRNDAEGSSASASTKPRTQRVSQKKTVAKENAANPSRPSTKTNGSADSKDEGKTAAKATHDPGVAGEAAKNAGTPIKKAEVSKDLKTSEPESKMPSAFSHVAAKARKAAYGTKIQGGVGTEEIKSKGHVGGDMRVLPWSVVSKWPSVQQAQAKRWKQLHPDAATTTSSPLLTGEQQGSTRKTASGDEKKSSVSISAQSQAETRKIHKDKASVSLGSTVEKLSEHGKAASGQKDEHNAAGSGAALDATVQKMVTSTFPTGVVVKTDGKTSVITSEGFEPAQVVNPRAPHENKWIVDPKGNSVISIGSHTEKTVVLDGRRLKKPTSIPSHPPHAPSR